MVLFVLAHKGEDTLSYSFGSLLELKTNIRAMIYKVIFDKIPKEVMWTPYEYYGDILSLIEDDEYNFYKLLIVLSDIDTERDYLFIAYRRELFVSIKSQTICIKEVVDGIVSVNEIWDIREIED